MNPYYEQDGITIYHGDCRELLGNLGDGLVVTDPPYGINLNNDWQNEIHGAANKASGGIVGDDGLIDHAGILSPYARRVVFGFPYLTDPQASGWLVWDKEPGFKGRSLTSPIEMAYSTTWKGFKKIDLMWSGYLRPSGSESKIGHPTQKPESLMVRIIEWHKDDRMILYPYMGSGTTLVAAKKLGRPAIGIEIEERYCEIAARRLAQGSLFSVEA
jgi:site-specific DNA-methyltransferase (adenine-specific)